MKRTLAAAVLAAAALAAHAETYRLDDSMSQVFPPTANWEWMPFAVRSVNTTLLMNLRVNVRIDTRAWQGRQGRIYMVMPLDGGGSVTAAWETRGVLLPGRMVTGERALVYSGPISMPVIEDTMSVRLTTDSRASAPPARRLAFHFELDTP